MNEIKLANGTYRTANFRFRAMSKLAGDEHRDQWLNQALQFGYDKSAKCPLWLEFIDRCMSKKSSQLLQRWMGLIFSGDTSFHRCLILAGCPLARRSIAVFMEEFYRALGVKDIVCFGFAQCLYGIRRSGNIPRVMLMDGWAESQSAQGRMLSVIGEGMHSINVRGRVHRQSLPMFFTFFVDELPANSYRMRPLEIELRSIDELWADCWQDQFSGVFNWAMQGLSQLRLKQWEVNS